MASFCTQYQKLNIVFSFAIRMSDAMIIPTRISAANWFNPAGRSFEPAYRSEPEQRICWLDELLGGGRPSDNQMSGGIVIPDTPATSPRALTMLLTGPPGTGKSTLATELCYRWATDEELKYNSYYATTEVHPPWLIKNTEDLWGPEAPEVFTPSPEAVRGSIEIGSFSRQNLVGAAERGTSIIQAVSEVLGLAPVQRETRTTYDVIVIDSLNVMATPETKIKLFEKFQNLISSGAKLVICVLDSPADGASEFWEFFCDIVIRLDRTHPRSMAEGYMLRTIEITKARYQQHAWGPHQLKIERGKGSEQSENETDAEWRERLARAHPFRTEGGIFIYPSVHYLLSTYKRSHPDETPRWVSSPIDVFNQLLEGGFPQGRCSALLGARGGHKSYLGFMHVLHRVLNEDEAGIIVSLRDDTGLTLSSIEQILKDWLNDKSQYWKQSPQRDKWEAWYRDLEGRRLTTGDLPDDLEVMYFPPGNITPEEFVHRLLLSVLRLKRNGKKVTLLFNSLDQLGPRFPLCAKEQLFVATVLQLLSGEGVTSIFVSRVTEDAAADDSTHGLNSIAELIMEFKHESGAEAGLVPHVFGLPASDPDTQQWCDKDHVTVRIVRHAGGHPAGARAALEMIGPDHKLKGIRPNGLQCFLIP
jgi:KaiC/GvpD/RAD55 family RecA-like ATPase